MKKMTKNRFKELCTNGAHLYVARVYNEEESFYKIGITSKESAYNRLLNLPYNFRILQEVFHPDPGLIFNLEKHLISRGTRYTPKIDFAGQSECVVEVDAILEYLNSLTWIDGIELKEPEKAQRFEGSYRNFSRDYIEALLKLEDKDSLSEEEISLLEQTKTDIEENPRFEALVEYVSIFGVNPALLEGCSAKLGMSYLSKRIDKYKEKLRLQEVLRYKYNEGDLVTNEELREELEHLYQVLDLKGKLKLSDINLAFETSPTKHKGKNAFRIVSTKLQNIKTDES